ncbi:MAG TPA: T9SS type A sorting domain-containing protein, partial [Catalimonadaceae bacterium]|nr:T9SS type A sorting domain-containing protein [Catalimonadaceae bacterium]
LFENTFNFTGLTYDAAETGVSLNIARTSGDVLTAGNSSSFEVIATTAPEPTVEGSIATSALGFNTVTLTLTPGNGANRVVVARAGSAVSTAPTDATPYTANNFFGSGSTTGAGEFVVYNGAGTSVTVNGLVQGTTYHFAVYEYNGTGCALNYLPAVTGIANVTAPTQTLVAGDIAFVQFRSTGSDGFSFVALKDIGGGTRIRFTDASYNGDAIVPRFLASETDHYLWTSPLATNGITAGTIVTLQGGSISAGTLTDTLGGIKSIAAISAGDNVFAYLGTRTLPTTMIAGFSSVPFITTGTATSTTSYRPGALAGDLAVELSTTPTDNSYLTVQNLCGTPASIRSVIASNANWFKYNVIVPPIQEFQTAAYWNVNVVGSLATEPTTSATVSTGAIGASNMTLNLGAGNGTGRIVIAKLTSNATDVVPTDGVIYSASSVYGSTEAGSGTGNYVVYSGTGSSVVVTSLSPLTSYTFTVYEYDDSPCINFKAAAPGTTTATTDVLRYYSKNAQKTNLENLSAWSNTANELGTSPADFTTPGIFYVIDDANSTIGANWSVGGASTRVIITNPGTFTIPAAFSLSTAGGSGVTVGLQGVLTMQNSTLPVISSVDSTNSTVNYEMGGTVTLPALSFCNLGLKNGVKAFPVGTGPNGAERLDNSIRVKGNLTVDATTLDPAGAPFSFLSCHGNVTSLNSSVWGTSSDGLTLTFRGNQHQLFSKSGGGPDLVFFKIACNKSGGYLTMGPSNNLSITQDVEMVVNGSARFIDGGNTIDLGDDLRLGGNGVFQLTGTFNMLGTTVGDPHNIEDNTGAVTTATLNNLTISTPNATDEVRFMPLAGVNVVNINGNLTIATPNASMETNANEIRLKGNFTNSSSALTSLVEGTSIFNFNGTSPQVVSSSVANEIYANVIVSNLSGVTFSNPITVNGNWTNNGSVSFGSNLVTFAGTATQNVGGSRRTTFSDLTINSAAGTGFTVSSTGLVSVTGAVTFGTGADLTVTPGGEFRLVSNGSGTARITSTTGAGTIITGNLTAERHVPVQGWHLTGTALSAQTIMDWNDDLATQGPMPGVETPNPGSNTSMIFEHDQTYTTNDNLGEMNGWKVPTTSAVSNLIGYRVFTPAGAVLDNSGAYSVGTKSFNLVNSGGSYPGYNLLVNPHLAPVDPTLFTYGGGVQTTVVVWNPTTEQYEYVGSPISGAVANGSINPLTTSQGFFVFTTINGSTLGIPETAKTTGGTFFRTASLSGVEVKIQNTNGKSDRTVFQFVNEASASYEPNFDAKKVLNPGMNIYTIEGQNQKLAINALPFEGEQMVVALGYQANAGSHTISLVGLENLNHASQVFLKDNETGVIVDLNQNATYSFVVGQDEVNNNRFELIFTNSVTAVNTKSSSSVAIYPNPVVSGSFTIATANLSGSVSVEVMDVLGRVIDRQQISNIAQSAELQFNKPATAGKYTVKVTDSKGSVVRSLIVQ